MRSTRGQLKEFFKDSFIWKDIVEEFQSWIDDNHLALEDPKGTMKLEDFKHHSAICTALRSAMNVGHYMLIDEELKEKEDGETRNE